MALYGQEDKVGGWYKLVNGEPVPIDEREPGSWLAPPEERTVAYTTFPNGAYVSTVFLGLDHRWGDGPPVLWETMAFWDGHALDNECERYTSRAEAEAGHERMVVRVRQAIQDEKGNC